MPRKVSRKGSQRSPEEIVEFIDKVTQELAMTYFEHNEYGHYLEVLKRMNALGEREGFSYVVGEMNAYLG